jgi:AcrR family transcriptional regulator
MVGSARPARLENGRRDLMDIAIDCFARYGYQGASIDRIAKAAGLTKGAIYYHFKDKEELLFAAVKNRVGQFERRVISDLGSVKDAVAALRHVTDVCLEHATKSNHRRLIVTLMVEAFGTNARLSAQFRDMMRRFRAFLRSIIEVGQSQGIFRADVSAITAAGVYAGAVMGAEIEYYQDPTHIDLDEHLHTFLDSYLTWLASPVTAPARKRRP